MQKRIKKYMFIALMIFFVELLAGVLFFLLYKLNSFNYLVESLVISLCFFILINVSYIWIVLNLIAKARKKNDVTALDIVGEDIQEVYNFGNLGIIIVDDNFEIIWTNDWFSDVQTGIVDNNIFVWKPELESLMDANVGLIEIEIDNRLYEVKFIREAYLFIFKDVTDYKAVIKFSKDHSPVIGLMAIDNYQDVMSLIDDTKTTDLIAEIKRTILEYGKEYGILIRQYHSDSYSFVATYDQYKKMYNDHFSILDRIHAIREAEENELTLSIGIAYGSAEYVRLNDLAASALDVCMSRGGDQVVIQPYGENLIFLGGRFEAKSQRSRVKIRVLSKSLSTLINDAEKVFIMGHKDMDLDALGASLGLYSFTESCRKEARIIYDERMVETKTKKAFKQSFTRDEIRKITITPKQASEEITQNTLLIFVDAHRPSIALYPKILEEANKIAVIDHHRRGEEFVDSPVYSYVEPSSSSASELVVELIRYNDKNIKLDSRNATMMLAGILVDTNFYRNKTGARTFDASVFLKDSGADNAIASGFLKEEFEEHALKVRIMSNASIPFFGIVVCKANEEDIIDRTMLAIVAQDFLQINGTNACFVIGRTDSKQVSISARSDGTINVQYLMERMNGGGHFAAAGAQFENLSIDEIEKQLKEVLDMYLQESRTERK